MAVGSSKLFLNLSREKKNISKIDLNFQPTIRFFGKKRRKRDGRKGLGSRKEYVFFSFVLVFLLLARCGLATIAYINHHFLIG